MWLIQYPSSLKLVDMKRQMCSLPQCSELFQPLFYFSALLFSDVHHQTSGNAWKRLCTAEQDNLGREAGKRNRHASTFWHAAPFLIISISLCIRVFKLFHIYFLTFVLPFLSLGQNCDEWSEGRNVNKWSGSQLNLLCSR